MGFFDRFRKAPSVEDFDTTPSQPITFALTEKVLDINGTKLTLPGAPQSARNAETGAPVDPGALKIPRRDFALIEVRGVR